MKYTILLIPYIIKYIGCACARTIKTALVHGTTLHKKYYSSLSANSNRQFYISQCAN